MRCAKCGFREGDKVKLTDPEKSTWSDLTTALRNNTLTVGRTYVIQLHQFHKETNCTIRVLSNNGTPENDKGWSVNAQVYTKALIRNLPVWF